ncbi:MAG: ribonuclease H-like domain-containing protein [Planctomycetes bacterium]|nr:ribonuclease H-like domain-containing protein [Planctomycetota bacterium]
MKAAPSNQTGSPSSHSFKDRLRQAVKQHVSVTPKPEVASVEGVDANSGAALEAILGGCWVETEHGKTLVVDEEYPLDHVHGKRPLSNFLRLSSGAFRCLIPSNVDVSPERFGFFDIETTGLSGGTGTYCFLAALGMFTERSFRVRQYFLADLLQERAMLTLLTEDLKRCGIVVTYNGRCFDVPCIDTRMLLARFGSPFDHAYSLDILYPVRRLYRHRLESCRLGETEQRLAGFLRKDDVPGWMAPTLYFDYLRAKRIAPMSGVLRHNRDDILSTLGVLTHLAELFADTEPSPDDAVALARWWEMSGSVERARQLYADALPSLEGQEAWRWAAARHAGLCKRAGERGEAARLWGRLWAAGDRHAGLELAKHFEHWKRDLPQAEEVTQRLLDDSPETDTAALQHRLLRIQRKLIRKRDTASAKNKATREKRGD